nr:DUF192 domain-containing protein [Pseudoroseicyclus aestuarii]
MPAFRCAAVLAGLALMPAASATAAGCRADRVTVSGDWGQARFAVEIADDAEERARGLMYREEMAPLAGMLFVYEAPQPASFWMRNTLIPLDILFADAQGRLITVHDRAVPLDETPIPGGDAVQYVLEINGGMADRLGITPGDVLQHPAIGPDAAAPCD